MDVYCPHCQGMVNKGGACPYDKQPDQCPLELTEQEHHAELAKQAKKKD